LSNGGEFGFGLDVLPSRLFRYKKDIFGEVFVSIFWITKFIMSELVVEFLKTLRNVFEKDKPQATFLYSAASIFLRSLSAALKSCASKFPFVLLP
jgi:hypothetical protein